MIARKREWSERKRSKRGKVMVIKGGRCDQDLRLVGREFQRRREELREERSANLNLDVKGGDRGQMWLEKIVYHWVCC